MTTVDVSTTELPIPTKDFLLLKCKDHGVVKNMTKQKVYFKVKNSLETISLSFYSELPLPVH